MVDYPLSRNKYFDMKRNGFIAYDDDNHNN